MTKKTNYHKCIMTFCVLVPHKFPTRGPQTTFVHHWVQVYGDPKVNIAILLLKCYCFLK